MPRRTSFPHCPVWEGRYNLPYSVDGASAVLVDAAGNVYVTGASQGSSGDHDFLTIKYNSAREEAWRARFNYQLLDDICYPRPITGDDVPTAMAVDAAGDVYVTGHTSFLYFCPVNHYYGETIFTTVKYDASGNAVVAGRSLGDAQGPGYATVKYDPVGGESWSRRFENAGVGGADDIPSAMVLDTSGSIHVTGASYNLGGTDYDFATVTYGSGGSALWAARYDGPVSGEDKAVAIAVDGGGNVYVTGTSMGDSTYLDYATVKYGPAGNELWVSRYTGAGYTTDNAVAVAVNGDGNVYVTGTSTRCIRTSLRSSMTLTGTRCGWPAMTVRQGERTMGRP